MSEPAAIAAASAAVIVATEAGAGEIGFSIPTFDDNPGEAIESPTEIIASAMARATA